MFVAILGFGGLSSSGNIKLLVLSLTVGEIAVGDVTEYSRFMGIDGVETGRSLLVGFGLFVTSGGGGGDVVGLRILLLNDALLDAPCGLFSFSLPPLLTASLTSVLPGSLLYLQKEEDTN